MCGWAAKLVDDNSFHRGCARFAAEMHCTTAVNANPARHVNSLAIRTMSLPNPRVSDLEPLDLLRLAVSVKRAYPFAALVDPHTSTVVRAGHVGAAQTGLQLRFVCNDSHLGMWKDHLDVC